ncbi:alpha-ketoglutarate-dependent dioxygenase AlkB [Alteromonadaceae bacterium M269]|nr:alpha-ketoglutarate-dependent dioxygenase AlkB [Alteromonadaceae bacterium M269]
MYQSDFFSESIADSIANLPQAELIYIPDFMTKGQASFYYSELERTLPWRQETIRIYGKEMLTPRLQSWHGYINTDYQYSELTMSSNPWTQTLLDIKTQCESRHKATYNSVLANHYRDGDDAVGWHADDEPELGNQPVIASVTLGCERTFSLRHNLTKQRIDLELESGSLLIMAGPTQQYWQHTIPRRKGIKEGRINLTFRYIYR